MDWDLKVPLWDLAELDRDADLNLGSVLGGPAGGSARQCPAVSGVDCCSVDLKLGRLGDSGSSFKWKDQPRISTAAAAAAAAAAAPSSRPSKRQRAPGNDGLIASCLVDGCRADLSKCREYHRRHKVCEVHSKTPVVVVGGQEQRFCQQCSRFHSLVEFDEVKRSCRKRLDGHNRRRRKPHPSSVNSGMRFSTYSQVFPTAMTELNWAGIITQDDRRVPDLVDRRNTLFVNSSQSYRRERRQFPFLQESETGLCSITTIGSLVGQAHRITNTTSEVMSSNNKMFSNGLTHAFHSDCALSLLSSPNQTSDVGLSHTMQSGDQIRLAQPLVSSMQYDLTQFAHSASEAVLVSNGNGADSHSQFIFCVGDGTPQVLPF